MLEKKQSLMFHNWDVHLKLVLKYHPQKTTSETVALKTKG